MFIPAFTTNAMTSDFILSIFPWLSDDVHRLPSFTFLSWLDLLGVALAVRISVIKVFNLLPNYKRRVTEITSFGKHSESSSGHTLTCFLNLVKYRFKNVTEGISHPVFYGDLFYKLRRVRCEANFVSSGSKIVKRLRRRKYDPVTQRTIGLLLGPSTALYRSFLKYCTLNNKAVGTL